MLPVSAGPAQAHELPGPEQPSSSLFHGKTMPSAANGGPACQEAAQTEELTGARVQQHPLWLTFEDAELESQFTLHYGKQMMPVMPGCTLCMHGCSP